MSCPCCNDLPFDAQHPEEAPLCDRCFERACDVLADEAAEDRARDAAEELEADNYCWRD